MGWQQATVSHQLSAEPVILQKAGEQAREYLQWKLLFVGGFPGGSDAKESACNAGDLSLTPGSGRSAGGGDD